MSRDDVRVPRRDFLRWAARTGAGAALLGVSPALLAACARDDGSQAGAGGEREPKAIVGDVVDFGLTSDDWPGEFGWVTFALHKGVFAGRDVYFIRTDASDEAFAKEEELVYVPKMASLVPAGQTAALYLVSGGVSEQPAVLASEPGREDYTPAWRVHIVRWTGTPRLLSSVEQVQAASNAGQVTVQATETVMNAPVVKWSGGEMPADDERTQYLGPGQLLEAPDTSAMRVTFKLHECYPGVRYIVTDTALRPMAEGMKVAWSPRLAGATAARATGRTNVFMNGIKGPGPMGFQPSVFDSAAGSAEWSPYWDHFTFAWKQGMAADVIESERGIRQRVDGGQLEEFAGTPETKGETFVVNCPVPVLAPNTFKG